MNIASAVMGQISRSPGSPSSQRFSVALFFCCVSPLWATALSAQAALDYPTLGVVDSWLSSSSVRDNGGNRVVLHSMSGWTDDWNLETRILGTLSWGGMASFADRSAHYEEILRQVVLQTGLGEADRVSFLANAGARLPDHEFVETLETLLLAGELTVATVDALNRYGLLDRPIATMAQAAGQLGQADAFSRLPDLPVALEHVSTALAAVGALASAVTVSRNVSSQVRAAVLWAALNQDLALRRIAALRSGSSLDDPAFIAALDRVASDLEATPRSTWEEMYRVGIQFRDVVNGSGMGIAALSANLATLSGASAKVMGRVSAGLFIAQQLILADDHRTDLQRMTAAATIYMSMEDASTNRWAVENAEALQHLFLFHRRGAFSNWAYNLVWQNESRSWREILREFETEEARYKADVIDRRITEAIRAFQGGATMGPPAAMLLSYRQLQYFEESVSDALARPILFVDSEGRFLDPWATIEGGAGSYCDNVDPIVQHIPLHERRAGFRAYREGALFGDSIEVRSVFDSSDDKWFITGVRRSGTTAFSVESGFDSGWATDLLLWDGPHDGDAGVVARLSPTLGQMAEWRALATRRLRSLTGEPLMAEMATVYSIETPLGSKLLIEWSVRPEDGMSHTRTGIPIYQNSMFATWRLLQIWNVREVGGGGDPEDWVLELELLSEPQEGDTGWRNFQLMGFLDVVGDGVPEIVLRQAAYLARGYEILKQAEDGSWQVLFSGGWRGTCT